MPVHLEKQVLIKAKAQVRVLLFNNAFTKILPKYLNYNNIFLAKNPAEILKHIKITDHTIKLEKSK